MSSMVMQTQINREDAKARGASAEQPGENEREQTPRQTHVSLLLAEGREELVSGLASSDPEVRSSAREQLLQTQVTEADLRGDAMRVLGELMAQAGITLEAKAKYSADVSYQLPEGETMTLQELIDTVAGEAGLVCKRRSEGASFLISGTRQFVEQQNPDSVPEQQGSKGNSSLDGIKLPRLGR